MQVFPNNGFQQPLQVMENQQQVYPIMNISNGPNTMQVGGQVRYGAANQNVPVMTIPGFETSGLSQPTSYYVQPPMAIQMDFSALSKTAAVSVDNAKLLLIQWVKQHCCYGTSSAANAVIECVAICNSLSIQYDTFIETRHTNCVSVPYRPDEPVLSPFGGGMAPQPWLFQLPPKPFFHNDVEKHEIPFTSKVERDHHCGGDGRVQCEHCGGDGKTRCGHCGGDGKVTEHRDDGGSHQVRCGNCGGDGKRECNRCNACGHVECPRCRGSGRLRHYIELVRQHKTLNTFEVLDQINDSDLPPALIKQAGGFNVTSAQFANILPPSGIAPDIDAALIRVKERASQAVINERGLQHQELLNVKVVPVNRFKATIEGKVPFEFFVYGTDSLVHCNNYPDTCACVIA